jgi:KDO2-lipid IV(A) lauroyltransferase
LKSAIAEGKGVVLAGNHFGNWELISAAISTQGAPIHIYAGKQRNSLFDNALNGIRQRFGTVTISKSKTATIEMMKVLKNNEVLGMAGDLNVPNNKLFIDFFGKKAAVGRGLASFALSRGTPLIFIWCVRTGPLQHVGRLCRVQYDPSGDKPTDLLMISQSLTRILEQKIREHPDQYFWFNKRWKTRPAEENGSDIY